MAKLEK